MEAWPAPPSQGFYFTHYQKFHQRWCCAAHSLNSESHPDQIAREWGRHLCTATVAEGNRVRQRKLGRGDRSATGSPTDVWTKTLRESACMSITSFYSHGLFRPSCLLEESSWVGGFVWPRSLGGQAFHQLLTQGCQPIHPQNLSMRGHGFSSANVLCSLDFSQFLGSWELLYCEVVSQWQGSRASCLPWNRRPAIYWTCKGDGAWLFHLQRGFLKDYFKPVEQISLFLYWAARNAVL